LARSFGVREVPYVGVSSAAPVGLRGGPSGLCGAGGEGGVGGGPIWGGAWVARGGGGFCHGAVWGYVDWRVRLGPVARW